MGDRVNIKMEYSEGGPIYFYSHWGGSEIKQTLAEALARKERWGDEPYLARIIFSTMIQDQVLTETGFGIAPYECDPENETVVVNCPNQTVDGLGFEDFINGNLVPS